MQAFLNQTSEKGVSNAQALQINDLTTVATWHGVSIDNGHVVAIDWKDKRLAGRLDLSGFTALKSLDVSHNWLSAVMLTGCSSLIDVNVSHNILTDIEYRHHDVKGIGNEINCHGCFEKPLKEHPCVHIVHIVFFRDHRN